MKVYLLSRPSFSDTGFAWFLQDEGLKARPKTTESDGEFLVETAGRVCYMSYGKGRKDNAAFIKNLIDSGHHSVLEHANWTLLFTGISRSCTHELVRHRHLSYSQLSQRYVDESEAVMLMPFQIREAGSTDVFERVVNTARTAYKVLVSNLELLYKDVSDPTARRKMARQAARSVLPNATETKIVVTGNARAWRHFITMRSSKYADPEIRALAIRVHEILSIEAPLLFEGALAE